MLPGEREVGGLRCSQVLAALSDYLDAGLPEEMVRQVAAHVQGCRVCEQFGGQFAQAIAALRTELREPEALPGDVADRLRSRLAAGSSPPGPPG